jgi:phage head maturation protease
MPRTPPAEALMVNIKRGDISGMSFAFRVPEGGDEWHREGPQVIREVRDLHLFDVSVVTFPAYPQTSVSVRSAYAAFASRPAVPSRATLELEHRHRIIVASLDRYLPPAVGSLSSK